MFYVYFDECISWCYIVLFVHVYSDILNWFVRRLKRICQTKTEILSTFTI